MDSLSSSPPSSLSARRLSVSLFPEGARPLLVFPLFAAQPRFRSLFPVDDQPFCLARPRSTLRPVIKQPRGGQIESVEETRERRRRGDGQLAATMVSIVKEPSSGALSHRYRCEAETGPKERNAGGGGRGMSLGLQGLGGRIHPWSRGFPPIERPGESSGYGPPPIASSFHRRRYLTMLH